MLVLREKDVVPNVRDPFKSLMYGLNKVRFHNRMESFSHFLTKCVLAKLIFNQKDGIITEYEYPDCKVMDVLQVKKDEIIGYQVETNSFEEKKFYNTSVLIVDLRKCPKEVEDAFKTLKNYFKEFIV